MSRFIITLPVLGLLILMTGCGGTKYNGDKRFPLAGDVTFEGQAVDLGSISFIPADGKGRAAGGVIEEGKYSIPEEKGATTGAYRVEIHWLKRTGKKLRDNESGEMYDERREAIPEKLYGKPELTVDVPLPKNRHDFNLKSS
jgi:hypothetical protein